MTIDAQPVRRSFFTDLMSVGVTRIAVSAMTILTGIIVAHEIGADGKGMVAALTVAPLLVLTFSELGVHQATAYMLGRKTTPDHLIVSTVAILFAISSTISAAVCIAYFTTTWLPGYTWTLILLAIATVPSHIAISYASGVFLGKETIVQFNRAKWVWALSTLILTILLVWRLRLDVSGVLLANALSGFGMALYAGFVVFRMIPFRLEFDPSLAMQLMRLGASYAAALFIITMFYKINIFLLQRLASLEELGIYALSANLAEYVWQIPSTMATVIFSRGANARDGKAFTQKVVVVFRVCLVLSIVAAVGIAALSPIVVPFVYGEDFRRAPIVLSAMLPGVVAFIVFRVLNTDLAGKGKPKVAMGAVLPGLAVNACLTLLLAPTYGALGAAAATSVSYLIAAIIYLALYCRALDLDAWDVMRYRKSDIDFVLARIPLPKSLLARLRPTEKTD